LPFFSPQPSLADLLSFFSHLQPSRFLFYPCVSAFFL
jgi:hypothetical protein